MFKTTWVFQRFEELMNIGADESTSEKKKKQGHAFI